MILSQSCDGDQYQITVLHVFIAMRPEDDEAKEKLSDPIPSAGCFKLMRSLMIGDDINMVELMVCLFGGHPNRPDSEASPTRVWWSSEQPRLRRHTGAIN